MARVGNAQMWAVLHRSASSKVVYGSPPDYDEMMAWRRILRPGDLFVDVGSNAGAYALWAADCGAAVIAVEPSAPSALMLRENVALNAGLDIEVLQCALAGEPGEMRLTEGLDTTNRLIPGAAEGELVQVRTLDDLIGDRVAAGVKVDVEGAERLVLDGASRALDEARIRVLQLEWNGMSETVLGEGREPVARLLRQRGYTFARPDGEGRLVATDDLTVGADLFAVAPDVVLDEGPR